MSFRIVLVSLSVFLLTRCTPDIGGDDYAVASVGQMSEVLRGVIKSKRTIKVDNQNINARAKNDGANTGTGLGTVAGAGLGAAIGSTSGSTTGTLVGAGLGAGVGSVVGHLVGRKTAVQQGYQYEIELDNGSSVSIAQGKKPDMGVGQRVRVLKGKDRVRVVPD